MKSGDWNIYEMGPVSVTIVRADRNQVWHLLPSTRQYKTLSYHRDYALPLRGTFDIETSRPMIGIQVLDGHPATLLSVTEGPSVSAISE